MINTNVRGTSNTRDICVEATAAAFESRGLVGNSDDASAGSRVTSKVKRTRSSRARFALRVRVVDFRLFVSYCRRVDSSAITKQYYTRLYTKMTLSQLIGSWRVNNSDVEPSNHVRKVAMTVTVFYRRCVYENGVTCVPASPSTSMYTTVAGLQPFDNNNTTTIPYVEKMSTCSLIYIHNSHFEVNGALSRESQISV